MHTATSDVDLGGMDVEQDRLQEGDVSGSSDVPATPRQSQEVEPALAEDSTLDQAAKKKKKKKKKKKRKSIPATGDAGSAEQGELDEEEEGLLEGERETETAPATATTAHSSSSQEQEEEISQKSPDIIKEVQPVQVDMDALTPPAPRAIFDLGREEAVPHRTLSGPYLKDALSKDGTKDKREDKWILKTNNAWSLEDGEGSRETSFGAWGVFDGHGGRQVATYASNAILKFMAEASAASELPLSAGPQPGTKEFPLPDVPGAALEDIEEWKTQAEFIRRLPTALKSAFEECNREACRRFKAGGTTATLAVACGWELVVANVGDSCAYLDTGSEVLAVSTTHRLQDSPSEVERIEASGGEVARSTVDGVPAGPIRVWPGGLAMSRSIGDVEACDRVCAEPEICQVTIPKDGARLIIGSDGLWDAVHPKTAAHHTREMPAAEAAHKLLALAIKKDHLKDDVTVVIVDFLPKEGDRLPPGLSLHRPASGKNKASTATAPAQEVVTKLAHVWHPLKGEHFDCLTASATRRIEVLEDARVEEETRVYEEQRRLERQQENEAAAAKAAAEAAEGDGSSGLYAELANLTLTPEDIQAAMSSEAKAMRAVQKSKSKNKPHKQRKEEEVGAEDEARRAEPGAGRGQQRQGRGGGSGRGRGTTGRGERGRGGRGGGRGCGPEGPSTAGQQNAAGEGQLPPLTLQFDSLPHRPPRQRNGPRPSGERKTATSAPTNAHIVPTSAPDTQMRLAPSALSAIPVAQGTKQGSLEASDTEQPKPPRRRNKPQSDKGKPKEGQVSAPVGQPQQLNFSNETFGGEFDPSAAQNKLRGKRPPPDNRGKPRARGGGGAAAPAASSAQES